MKDEIALPPGIKHCPICANELPVSEFGICRARKDGRNLYCKSCIRNKVTQSRRALKEYKSARKKYIAQQVEMSDLINSEHLPATSYTPKSLSKLSPVERVRDDRPVSRGRAAFQGGQAANALSVGGSSAARFSGRAFNL